MAGTITLRTAFANYPHVRALKDGSVASDRVRFDFEDVPVITRAFRRMVRTLDFDFCEIALTTLAQGHAFGKPIKALPIVVMRGFHHGALVCPWGRRSAGRRICAARRSACGRGLRRLGSGCGGYCWTSTASIIATSPG
jgi:hypothetical protein